MDNQPLPVLVPAASGEEFLCARCARHQATCCQTSEIYCTPGDVRRIAAHTGENDFYHYTVPDDPVYYQHDDDPNWPRFVFQPDGTRRVLLRRAGGDCHFLGAAGCTLPGEVRPLVCRLYPLEYNEQGITAGLGRNCPRELLAAGQDLVAALAMDRDAAERWRAQLYQEIREETNFHADRAHLRPAS